MCYQNLIWGFLPRCLNSSSPYVVSQFFFKPSFFGMNAHTVYELFQDSTSLRVKMSMVCKPTVMQGSLYAQLP